MGFGIDEEIEMMDEYMLPAGIMPMMDGEEEEKDAEEEEG